MIYRLKTAKSVFPACSMPQKVFSTLLFPTEAKQAPSISTCSWRIPYGTQPKFEWCPNMKPFASEGNSCSSSYFICIKGLNKAFLLARIRGVQHTFICSCRGLEITGLLNSNQLAWQQSLTLSSTAILYPATMSYMISFQSPFVPAGVPSSKAYTKSINS